MIALRRPGLPHLRTLLAISCSVLLLRNSISASQEQTAPTDAAIRSAYCIPIVQRDVENGKQLDADLTSKVEAATSSQARALFSKAREGVRKLIADSEAALSRLRASVLSSPQADPAALSEAQKRGEADQLRSQTEAKACSDKCFRSAPYDEPKIRTCMHSCEDPELESRVKACEKPDWLPTAAQTGKQQ